MKKLYGSSILILILILILIDLELFCFAQEGETPRNAPEQGESVLPPQIPQVRSKESLPSPLIPGRSRRKEIIIEPLKEDLESRMNRNITLDVREMNVIDVLKFLALKGDFNMVTSNQVQGRVTLFLKNVSIRDALDIILISNNLAYHLEKDIVHVMSAVEYQALLGKKFNDKNIVEIVQLNYAKPSYVLAALDNVKSDLGRIIIDEDTGSVVMIDTPQSVEKMKETLSELETPLDAFVYPLQFAKADVVAEKLKARIDANSVGTITVDERTNKIIMRAFKGRREEVEKLIKTLDAPTKEVLVEMRVLQVAFNPKMDMGIDWQLDFRDSTQNILQRMNFQNIMMDEVDLSTSSNLLNNFSKIGIGDFDVNQFELAIRALRQVSDTRILSNPKILVTNNEEAKIHVGDTVPYIISTTSGTGENAVTSEDVRFVDVGIKLSVTPTINDDGFITMVLNPEISTVVGSITSQGGGIPKVNKTLVETTVVVKDGMTIILGGLRKENKVYSIRGVPLLMDVPFLKGLFSSTSESVESTEIVIFITPHILMGDEGTERYEGDIKISSTLPDAREEEQKIGVVNSRRLELKP